MPIPTTEISQVGIRDIMTTAKTLKLSRRELADFSGQRNFWYALIGEYLAKALMMVTVVAYLMSIISGPIEYKLTRIR